MRKITKSAHDEPCQIRLAGYCNRNSETTVLAHYRLADYCGMGIKPPDYLGAYACSCCHDAVDGRIKTDLSEEELRLAHAVGVMRTLVILEKKGLLDVS